MQISQIDPDLLLSTGQLESVWASEQSHYWSIDWSPENFEILARLGFMSVSMAHPAVPQGRVLIPELQTEYAVLDWERLHIGRTMRRWMASRTFDELGFELIWADDVREILDAVDRCHGESNWLTGPYRELMTELVASNHDREDFEVLPIGLRTGEGRLVAGEIGYLIGSVYTSLTGFFERGDRSLNHAGKLQLIWLTKALQERQLSFWNLGHPHMPYKMELGAEIVSRADFLERWRKGTALDEWLASWRGQQSLI